MRAVETVPTDGSTEAATRLGHAAADALAGRGPAVLPTGPDDPPPPPDLLAPVDDTVAAVVTTTGSTGAPKAVLLPAAALIASADATTARIGPPGRWLLALPAHHVAGLQVLLRSARAGVPAAVMDLRDGFRPDAFAALAGSAAYTSLVPTQLVRLLDAGGRALDALRSFTAVLLGGAAADPALLDRARAAGVPVVTTYGMSETCGGCVYDGRPLDGVTVTLADGSSDTGGRIHLGGATLAAGYRGAVSPADATAFDGGVFRTNDLGAWTPDGRLEVLGRADDVIVTGGENVAPAAVERALLAQVGVREACVVGLPDPEWGARVVAAVVGDDLDPEALRAAVAPGLGRAAPRAVTVLDALPLRGIGKPDRAAVRALLAGG
ncbi:O-succinylbenzoic acid--CoA ligase [Actinomycetospora sp. NBRC 106375]|uniref:o-succinylbenzoate--CoA ligase n=1 Tax=Actinomycetospora sp. NBRC 106375 TaxID=3032207 RepID=UPI00249FA030|nr:o-succinylbenzoate--CoA ligase [Actinomycetospora sp. NBRC 106375]GLZ47576.1 O-succinylbenzoic acid--CoA ligase [Actinomycetospora sp. NBRC 106375]